MSEKHTPREGAAMSDWQPIETAPKDGTRIIVGKESGYVMAWASSAYWFNREPCRHSPACKPGTHVGWTDGFDTLSAPTHWMPLPAPPVQP
jgi:hypothetical protein